MGKLGFSVDRGGTFTDVCVFREDGSNRVLKLLSEDPANYRDAPTEAIRRVLQEEKGLNIPKGTSIPIDEIAWIRMGTTVATNALLERKGERIALLITKGFRDLLYIGNQTRPDIFALDIRVPDVLYEEVYEVDERVIIYDGIEKGKEVKTATNGKKMLIERSLCVNGVRESLTRIKKKGIDAVVVLFLHSHIFPAHELEVGRLAEETGITHVSLSHQIIPMIKAVPRGLTACVDGYLTPKIKEYIAGFTSAFSSPPPVQFMQSDGGLCDVSRFIGSRAILSGPAGGVVGVARTAFDGKKPAIGFDMGGTSTDVCRFAGTFEHVMQSTTAGVIIQIPQLEIKTVAAGGGSRLFFNEGRFVVGPESAGAHPGPACYRKGGPLAITDANLVLGRIKPELFPNIFGESADLPLDREGAVEAMQKLTAEINEYEVARGNDPLSVEQVALGFVRVANEEMCRPIRALTQAKGYDTKAHVLCCFGGAGGQHACAVARALGIEEVLVHRFSGVLSAYGIALADSVAEAQEASGLTVNQDNLQDISTRLVALSKTARDKLTVNENEEGRIDIEHFLHLRYARTDCAMMISAEWKEGDSLDAFIHAFTTAYERLFGFTLPDRDVIADDVRARAVQRSTVVTNDLPSATGHKCKPFKRERCFFDEGSLETDLYHIEEMYAGHTVEGPAILVDKNSTLLVEPNCLATALSDGNIKIVLKGKSSEESSTKVDPIRLSIFSNRFMSLAEQMGQVLQRTSISTNIKERLDFSCAIFGPTGGLVANAPHIPVHLGGMQYAVKFQIEHLGLEGIKRGDVILSNHPRAGGSHLPDFTVITPVFFQSKAHPVFFVANRGHHADIGGLVPGSLPPNATHIEQEGAAFISFKVVDQGVFQEETLVEQLKAPGKVKDCSPTRNIPDVIADLKAQIAANKKGIELVVDLMEEYGEDVVVAYMQHIMKAAEESVRALLKKVAAETRSRTGSTVLKSIDRLDDGTPIVLTVSINEQEGSAIFDFTGTGAECLNCCNTPRAVTMSAVIYCIRCLVGREIPLNEGCLVPIEIVIPPHSLLSPSETAAVGGGNIQTSQRICDVVFKAFGAVSGGQGDMNNVMFGDETMGYYETIGGGAGAGKGFHGRSGIHVHMTNTAITDPEILEDRYPVILREFSLREGSGGRGKWKGGEGLVRKMEFTRPLSLSLLTERRSLAPYALEGGEEGGRGRNHLIRASGTVINVGSKCTVNVQRGDALELLTPGGGGYGKEDRNGNGEKMEL